MQFATLAFVPWLLACVLPASAFDSRSRGMCSGGDHTAGLYAVSDQLVVSVVQERKSYIVEFSADGGNTFEVVSEHASEPQILWRQQSLYVAGPHAVDVFTQGKDPHTQYESDLPIESVVVHPQLSDIWGMQLAAGSFVGMPTNVTVNDVVQCVFDPRGEHDLLCRQTHKADPPSGLVTASVALQDDTNEQVALATPVTIFDQPVPSVTYIVSMAEAVVVHVPHNIYVNRLSDTRGQWSRLSAPFNYESLELLEEPQTPRVMAVAKSRNDGPRHLWTLSSVDNYLNEALPAFSEVARVGDVQIAQDTQGSYFRALIDGPFEPALSIPRGFDFHAIHTSPIMHITRCDDGLAWSYDGWNWDTVKLPFDTTGMRHHKRRAKCMLADDGSVVVCGDGQHLWYSLEVERGIWIRADDSKSEMVNAEDWITLPKDPVIVSRKSQGQFVRVSFLNSELPPCDKSLLEFVNITGIRRSGCILGEQISVPRRKRAIQCLYSTGSPHKRQSATCKCERLSGDFICGPKYLSKNGQCVRRVENDLEDALSGGDASHDDDTSLVRNPNTKCFVDVLVSGSTAASSTPPQIITLPEVRDIVQLPMPIGSSGKLKDTVISIKDSEILTVAEGDTFKSVEVKDLAALVQSPTPHAQVVAYAVSADGKDRTLYVSWDRGLKFNKIKIPAAISLEGGVRFHPKNPNWMMVVGKQLGCRDKSCPEYSYISKNSGKSWRAFYTGKCFWVTGLEAQAKENDELVYCESSEGEKSGSDNGKEDDEKKDEDDNDIDDGIDDDDDDVDSAGASSYRGKRRSRGSLMVRDLYWSTDYFKTPGKRLDRMQKTAGVFPFGNYIAARDESGKPVISADGLAFDDIRLPANVPWSNSGTSLLHSNEKSLWLFQTVSSRSKELFGTLLKSDEAGVEYVKSLENVNRRSGGYGYVDFEHIRSVPGVILTNVVLNADAVLRYGAEKTLGTFITHSDGAKWAALMTGPGPSGERLHLQGFSARVAEAEQEGGGASVMPPSPDEAYGVIIGNGNIGDSLLPYRESHTYLSKDAGMTWKEIDEKPMHWAIANYGNLIVLADRLEPTDSVKFSVDAGETWETLKVSDRQKKVLRLLTAPEGTGMIVTVLQEGNQPGKMLHHEIRFRDNNCRSNDFTWWEPEHPQLQTKCLLGREQQYLRLNVDNSVACNVDGFVSQQRDRRSDWSLKRHKFCECTAADYECDFNYELDEEEGRCVLVEGAPEPTKENQCRDGAISWRKFTGYRKVAASECVKGEQLPTAEEFACPGKEKEFEQRKKKNNNNNENDKKKSGNNNNNKNNNKDDNKGNIIVRMVQGILNFIFFSFILVAISIAGVLLYRKYIHASPLQLGSSGLDDDEEISGIPVVVRHAWSNAVGLWQLVRNSLPIFGTRVPQDHLGFYSRMDDFEGRYGESDDGFTDGEDGYDDDNGEYDYSIDVPIEDYADNHPDERAENHEDADAISPRTSTS